MRQNIKVMGIGKRMRGTSKAGNPYDFIPVYFAFKEQDCQGFRCETVAFNPPEFPENCAPGIEYDAVFPFCIPFDLYAFLTCLNAEPEAPVISWQIPVPGVGNSRSGAVPLEIDLSAFDSVAQLLRRLQLLLFCVGLAFKTRDLIKG